MDGRTCTVSLALLQAAPFSLTELESISLKVISINALGESDLSQAGNGAVIWNQPDAPINLANDALLTDATTIAFTWQDGPDGGTPIIDYKLWYGLETDSFTLLESALTSKSYQTTVTLVAGSNYKFKLKARTLYGYSEDSSELIIRAARIPDIPTDVTTTSTTDDVTISWTQPYNGGSAITAYTIQIRQSDGVTFSEELTSCDGSDSTIIS